MFFCRDLLNHCDGCLRACRSGFRKHRLRVARLHRKVRLLTWGFTLAAESKKGGCLQSLGEGTLCVCSLDLGILVLICCCGCFAPASRELYKNADGPFSLLEVGIGISLAPLFTCFTSGVSIGKQNCQGRRYSRKMYPLSRDILQWRRKLH